MPLSDATYVILLMSVGVVNRMYFQTTHHHNSNGIISSDVKSRWKMMLQVLCNFVCGFSHVVHFDKVFFVLLLRKKHFHVEKKNKMNKTAQERKSLTPFICIFPLFLARCACHSLLTFFFSLTHLILCLGQMTDYHKVQGFLSSVQTSFWSQSSKSAVTRK